jgi:hypothetical protein
MSSLADEQLKTTKVTSDPPLRLDSESEDEMTPRKSKNHKRIPIEWRKVVCFVKDGEKTLDGDEMS